MDAVVLLIAPRVALIKCQSTPPCPVVNCLTRMFISKMIDATILRVPLLGIYLNEYNGMSLTVVNNVATLPFPSLYARTCLNVLCCEKACNQINASLAYIDKISILSQDDDHYRLTSKSCEDIGLQRINNPKKAYGPVATGSVSLTSGITLSIHVAN